MSTVIQLRRRPAYKPLDPPGTCQTPGHDREARDYPGGRLCDECIRKSRQTTKSSNEMGEPDER